MKHLLLALLSLATFNLAHCQNASVSQDYLIRLSLTIAESRIPNYLVGVIYNRPEEKNITSHCIHNLYRTDNITLNTTRLILQRLNITENRVFSINSFNYTLELFNWTFTNFYNSVTNRLNLSGAPLRNALLALQLDVNEFSAGITWGDPDPWLEFIKGNFTEANMELACSQAGITMEILWAGVRDIFIDNLITFQIRDFVQLLLAHTIGQSEALIIWNIVPVTLEHVYSLPRYNEILSNFSARINNQTALGVLTTAQDIVVHRSIYEVFREERDLLDIQALTLSTRTSLNVSTIDDTIYHNLVVLRHTSPVDNLIFIDVARLNSNLTNCSYITFLNNNILTVNVPLATFNNETYEIPRSLIQNVISGSALVCNATIYGLVRGIVEDQIVADAFSNFVAPNTSTAGEKMFLNSLLGVFILIAMKFLSF